MNRKLIKSSLLAGLVTTLALLQISPAPAQATTVGQSGVDGFVCLECAGECIHMTGVLHFQSQVTFDGAGGVTMRFFYNFSNVRGVGVDSGREYRITNAQRQMLFHFREPDFYPAQFGASSHFNVIAPGTTEDWHVRVVFHITLNANGAVTAVVDNSSFQCQ